MISYDEPYQLVMRRTYPDSTDRDHFWTVLDHRGNDIGCINYHNNLRDRPKWRWSIGFWLGKPFGASDGDWEHTRQDAMTNLKAAWLVSLRAMTDADYQKCLAEHVRRLHQGLEWPRRQGDRFAKELIAAGYVRIPEEDRKAIGGYPPPPHWRRLVPPAEE